MSRVYFIHDARGERYLNETDLPLCVGGSDYADVVLPDVPADAVIAHIALAEGHAYIQPADATVALFHNHEHLGGSQWLKSGDQVQAGESVLHWTVKGDQVLISVRHRIMTAELEPPQEPPPAASRAPAVVPAVVAPDAAASPRRYRTLRRFLGVLFFVLVLAAAFVLLATPVELQITPAPQTQSLSGFPPPLRVANRLLALPGSYSVRASREGYHPLEAQVQIGTDGFQEFSFVLEELPGRVTINVAPRVPFRLFVAEVETPTDSGGVAGIHRGMQRLRVETERYLPESRDVDIAGLGKAQEIALELQPAWAEVEIASQPAGAGVQVDGEPVGTTPLVTEIMQGRHTIGLSMEGYKPYTLEQAVVAGEPLKLDAIELLPADGRLALSSTPAGATVSVGGTFRGTTPVELTLAPDTGHRIRLSKPGYQLAERSVKLAPEEARELAVDLSPEYGVLFITARPADAELVVDGKPVGEATRRLRLTTRPHTLEFRKPGYITQRLRITPRASVSRNVDVKLQTPAGTKAAAPPAVLTTAGGQSLRLIRPAGSFRMGASRREAGRRANESQRLVELVRPFYLASKEVSNAQFRRFRAAHNSGTAEGVGLDGDDQPVVNVNWDDAARYCNWLSNKDGLPPAYREEGGRMVAVRPATTGYRMPTEAEWAYVARVHGRAAAVSYPWSGNYPPKSVAGNYADKRIADTLADVVPDYDDGYRGTAPVGSFTASAAGFHDLGGNVAEWIHDFYAVYPGEAQRLVKDPAGPATGDHHVVRDASWRRGSLTELRLSYRDYSRVGRDDLGFRIARYAR